MTGPTDPLDAAERARLEARIGYRFRDPDKLERAMTHRSFANETLRDLAASYERLEFLGDALLGFLVSERLLAADPDADEGVLTRRRQVLVRTETLAGVARELGLGASVRLSRGEETTGGRDKDGVLADVFEALVAAVFLDGGVRSARAFVRRVLRRVLERAAESERVPEDYKTRLQELAQRRLRVTPGYRIVRSTGPDHEKRFHAEVRLDRRRVGSGSGTSRKRAEQSAARDALRRLGREAQEDP